LRAIIEGSVSEKGEEFFFSLVIHLTSTLPVQYAVIGDVLEGRLRKIRTLAVPAGNTLVDNFENVRILTTGGRPAEHPSANGRGFNQASVKGNGHGLRHMAARTQKIGGRLTVLSKVN
jgi:hypothetical protein